MSSAQLPSTSASDQPTSTPKVQFYTKLGLNIPPSRCNTYVRKFINDETVIASKRELIKELKNLRKVSPVDEKLVASKREDLSAVCKKVYRCGSVTNIVITSFVDDVVSHFITANVDQCKARVLADQASAKALDDSGIHVRKKDKLKNKQFAGHKLCQIADMQTVASTSTDRFVHFVANLPSFRNYTVPVRAPASAADQERRKQNRDERVGFFEKEFTRLIGSGVDKDVARTCAKAALAAFNKERSMTESQRVYDKALEEAVKNKQKNPELIARDARVAFNKKRRDDARAANVEKQRLAKADPTYVKPVRVSPTFNVYVRRMFASIAGANNLSNTPSSQYL